MARDPQRSRRLRQLADRLLAGVPDELLTSPRAELATSLVRQWQTYDDHATLVLGGEQHYFKAAVDSGDELQVGHFRVDAAVWFAQCARDHDLDEGQLREAVRQLNVGQSAEVRNRRGEPLRLWANPKDRQKGIEALNPRAPAPGTAPDYAKVARSAVESVAGATPGAGAKEELAASLVRQWAAADGHAVLLTPKAKLHIIAAPQPGGLVSVETRTLATSLPRKLRSCGLTDEGVARLLRLVNLGQAPVVTDEQGRRCQVRVDPRSAEVWLEVIA